MLLQVLCYVFTLLGLPYNINDYNEYVYNYIGQFAMFFIQGVQKKTIENDLLLEFQWPSTKMNVKSIDIGDLDC